MMMMLATVQLSNIIQNIMFIAAEGPPLLLAFTDRDRSTSYVHGAFDCAERRDVIKNRPRNKTSGVQGRAPACSTRCFDPVPVPPSQLPADGRQS